MSEFLLKHPKGELPLPVREGTENPSGANIGSLLKETGYVALDHGFMNTAACESKITFIDGDEGVLRYRGYPIEELAEKSTFLETSYLLIYGELPSAEQLADFSSRLRLHTLLHEEMRRFFDGFPRDAHPMAVLSSAVSALSTFYQDSLDPFDRDGYLGRRIAAALPDEELILAVRSSDAAELAGKTARLGAHVRGAVVPVDLRDHNAFAAVDPRRITRIIHAAAVTRFDVDRETAWQVNVAGTARVQEFAERCDRLERLILLSTLYTAGRRRGEVHEIRHEDIGFVNHYEWSKWAAEECVLDQPGPPVTVLRLPTVISDDDHGTIGQYNAFHHTLRLYSTGLLTLLPGDPTTPLSLATAGFTVGAVVALLDAEPGIYQVCSGQIPLSTTLDTAFAVFDRDPGFRRRMLPRPILCDRDSFHDMVSAAQALRGGELHAALGWVGPFAEQLYLPKVFRADRLHAACPELRAPDPRSVVESVCTNLIAGRTHAQH